MTARLPQRNGRRGAILVLVLISLAAVSVIASMMIREVAVEYASSASVRNTVSGAAALDSGLLLAADVLMRDKSAPRPGDSLWEEWGRFPLAAEQIGQGMEGMEITGTIEDESGRFPLFAMIQNDEQRRRHYQDIFRRLVVGLAEALGIDGRFSVADLVESMRNWIKDPDTTSVPEDEWYEEHEPSYRRKGSWFGCPEEMLLLWWDGIEEDQFKILLHGRDDIPGLADMVSVWSRGPININTAPDPVVLALSDDESKAEAFLAAVREYRDRESNDFAKPWHKDVAQKVGINEMLFPEDCLGQTSTLFRIHLQASRGEGLRRHTAVVEVSPTTCKVLMHKAH